MGSPRMLALFVLILCALTPLDATTRGNEEPLSKMSLRKRLQDYEKYREWEKKNAQKLPEHATVDFTKVDPPISDSEVVTGRYLKDVRFTINKTPCPDGFLKHTENLNQGVREASSIFMCTQQANSGRVIVDVLVHPTNVYSLAKIWKCPQNWSPVLGAHGEMMDLNQSGGGDLIFMCVRYSEAPAGPKRTAVRSLGIFNTPCTKRLAAEGWRVPKGDHAPANLNKGTEGKIMYMCMKSVPDKRA